MQRLEKIVLLAGNEVPEQCGLSVSDIERWLENYHWEGYLMLAVCILLLHWQICNLS